MTRRIRKLHFIAWWVIAVVLPIVIIASVGLRHREPVNDRVPQRTDSTR